MNIETEQFALRNVRWNHVRSGEITGTGMAPEPIKAGIQSADVLCKCGHFWHATANGGAGGIKSMAAGGDSIKCPKCDAEGQVPGS